jgi:hypothetical protein
LKALLVAAREVSAREVIAAHIGRIEVGDGAVNALVTRCFERAIAKAAAADQALARGGWNVLPCEMAGLTGGLRRGLAAWMVSALVWSGRAARWEGAEHG